MRHRRKAFLAIVLLAVIFAVWALVDRFALTPPPPAFRFTTVERGDVQAVVSATGTLQAVTTVSVGTQVSGQVSAVHVDFNAEVKKGQLLARIDPTIAQQGVADAQANLERLKAQTAQASRDQDRNRSLQSEGLIPESQSEQGGAALQVAQASEKSAAIALQRARQNLSFTSIYAPIDGVVVERNVNPGQTVAASLSAPQLFLIANDLTRMQILAQVSESDIARIAEGQVASFTVQARSGESFQGSVEQVRLQSTTADNVVNYTVVVSLANPDKKLLPGMTARVDFRVSSAQGVLKVANAALRYRPSEEVLALLEASPTPAPAGSPGVAGDAPSRPGRGARSADGSRGASGGGTLHSVGPDGKLRVHRVRTGITDGLTTEVSGRDLAEGMKVIDGVVSASSAARPAANPLGGSQQSGGRRAPGSF